MDYNVSIRSQSLRIETCKAYSLSKFRHKFNAMVANGFPKILSMEEKEMNDFFDQPPPAPLTFRRIALTPGVLS